MRRASILCAALLLVAGCGGAGGGAADAGLTTIRNVGQVERAFDDDAGHARLVLLLSPT